jgi:hypothetical protein
MQSSEKFSDFIFYIQLLGCPKSRFAGNYIFTRVFLGSFESPVSCASIDI